MKLDQKSASKLASLSALGAGALVAGMGTAKAGAILQTFSPAKQVGFSSGFHLAFSTTNSLYGGAGFKFLRQAATTGNYVEKSVIFKGLGGVQFQVTGSYGRLRLFLAGQSLGVSTYRQRSGTAAVRSFTQYVNKSTPLHTFTSTTFKTYSGARPGPFKHEFAMFTFPFNSQTYYGWVELSLAVTDATTNDPGSGPDLSIEAWAFDNAPLNAGSTTPSGVPEPGTLPMMGLGALVLGAAGIRRWKRTKNAA